MGTIENLTRTHIALDVQLVRFQRLLRTLAEQSFDDVELARLAHEAQSLLTRLERHLANEVTLEERSDHILGPGAMEDYSVGEHQRSLRDTAENLVACAREPEALDELFEQLEAFAEQFAAYSRAEWEFLQANASILYPGGTID